MGNLGVCVKEQKQNINTDVHAAKYEVLCMMAGFISHPVQWVTDNVLSLPCSMG